MCMYCYTSSIDILPSRRCNSYQIYHCCYRCLQKAKFSSAAALTLTLSAHLFTYKLLQTNVDLVKMCIIFPEELKSHTVWKILNSFFWWETLSPLDENPHQLMQKHRYCQLKDMWIMAFFALVSVPDLHFAWNSWGRKECYKIWEQIEWY